MQFFLFKPSIKLYSTLFSKNIIEDENLMQNENAESCFKRRNFIEKRKE